MHPSSELNFPCSLAEKNGYEPLLTAMAQVLPSLTIECKNPVDVSHLSRGNLSSDLIAGSQLVSVVSEGLRLRIKPIACPTSSRTKVQWQSLPTGKAQSATLRVGTGTENDFGIVIFVEMTEKSGNAITTKKHI